MALVVNAVSVRMTEQSALSSRYEILVENELESSLDVDSIQ